MQYHANTPSEYLESLEDDWRKEKVVELRDMITSTNSDIEESIEYKMLNYKLKGVSVFHLNAQKNYVSLYVGDICKIESGNELLAGLDTGKGCIRIKKSIEIDETKLDEFIMNTIQMVESNKDISC